MPALILKLEGDGALKDLVEGKQIIHLTNPIHVAALDGGMSSGKASVALGFDIGEGRVVVAETSLSLFLMAADALRAKFPHNG